MNKKAIKTNLNKTTKNQKNKMLSKIKVTSIRTKIIKNIKIKTKINSIVINIKNITTNNRTNIKKKVNNINKSIKISISIMITNRIKIKINTVINHQTVKHFALRFFVVLPKNTFVETHKSMKREHHKRTSKKGGNVLMKTKLIGLTLAASVALVGCNTNNDQEEGMRNTDDQNPVEQTRYNEDMNDLDQGVRQKDDKNTYDRDQVDTNDRADNDNQRDRTDDHRKTDDDNKDRYAVSKDAANRITDDVKEIDGAYVVTTKNNAYVAAKLDKN